MFKIIVHVLSYLILSVDGDGSGLLLLYHPRDISSECAFSTRLRFDLSFGMGMSDTLTVVFRTLSEVDYECVIEIVAEREDVLIILVIKYPTSIATNCKANHDAFTVMKNDKCLRLCDLLTDRDVTSAYFVGTLTGRIKFRFLSNSSINSEINADTYQVTMTTARKKPDEAKCFPRNETTCVIEHQEFCITSGIFCDGIKNCGVTDWFDERKSDCGLPVEYLTYAPVMAVAGAVLCVLMAAGHVMLRCLPPLAKSFFIFNVNEDNRLCIDAMFKSPGQPPGDVEEVKRTSLIPISSSSSSSNNDSVGLEPSTFITHHQPSTIKKSGTNSSEQLETEAKRKTTLKGMTAKFQEKIRSVTGYGASAPKCSRDVMDA